MIVQNEEHFEIFLDELRKPTNDLSVIDVGQYSNRASHNIFVNVTVLLIASTPVMYLKKTETDAGILMRDFWEKHTWETK